MFFDGRLIGLCMDFRSKGFSIGEVNRYFDGDLDSILFLSLIWLTNSCTLEVLFPNDFLFLLSNLLLLSKLKSSFPFFYLSFNEERRQHFPVIGEQ